MTKLTNADYHAIADELGTGRPLDFTYFDSRFYIYDETPVVAKERPRLGKGGRMYTPPDTVKFEKRVKNWARKLDMPKVYYPIRVSIVILDPCDDMHLIAHSYAGLVYNHKNDIDNCAKAILDGLNKVAFDDDKQITQLNVSRRYEAEPGFELSISRNGLSKNEYVNFLKFVRS